MSNTADLNDNDGLRVAAAALRSSGWLRLATMVEQHIAEVERLRAEVERLRAEVDAERAARAALQTHIED